MPFNTQLQTYRNKYIEEDILVHTGPPWLRQILECAIAKGSHVSEFSPEMTAFICGDMQQRVRYGFGTLLPAADAVQVFGEKLKLSSISVPPRRTEKCTPSSNYW